ncbi:unnamed protein product [Moneuplotes crassus]|uniref:Uncharacterized protein n=1 Tax=Euplotes crassus TaxID=5936 RepID=A0AAD2D1Y1_EUPCR|nr:unnamed protein product [Moneuplotes crassus]
MFAEPFQTVKRCTDCNACFTTKYSQPVHKTLISGFIPSDLSSLHSVYTTVLRSPESESGGFNSMNELLLDAEAQPVNHANPQAETIRKGKLKIVETIDKKWEENGGKDGITRSEFSDKIHSENYDRIENEISKRNQHLTYLRVVFQNLIDLESEIEYYKKDFHVALKSDKLAKSNSNQYPISFTNLKLAYDNLFKNYRFGCANRKLESFASINKQMKYANQIFKKSNKSIASKELFENLTNDQKRDLKSFHRMRFTKLLRDGTIVNLNRMPELESIKNNLGVTFFEDQNYNIQGQVIFKDRPKTAMCGAAIKNTKSSILVVFILTFS